MGWADYLPPYRDRPIGSYGWIRPRVLVIHQTTGDMDDGSDAVAYMFSRDDGIRWHWTVGADGTAWRHADFARMMAHALGINSISVGIEHDMPATGVQPPRTMLETSASIAAAFCHFIRRAPSREFIIGHNEDHRFGGTSSHSDPVNWPWGDYMELVRAKYEGEDMAFEEFKKGWQSYRDGANLPEDAAGDFKWGWLQARSALTSPKPEEHEHPHIHEHGETGREKKVY